MNERKSKQLELWHNPKMKPDTFNRICSEKIARVVLKSLQGGIEGLTYSEGTGSDKKYHILINVNKPWDIQELTFTHEVVHILRGINPGQITMVTEADKMEEKAVTDEALNFYTWNTNLVSKTFSRFTRNRAH